MNCSKFLRARNIAIYYKNNNKNNQPLSLNLTNRVLCRSINTTMYNINNDESDYNFNFNNNNINEISQKEHKHKLTDQQSVKANVDVNVQRSLGWFKERHGKITASMVYLLLTKKDQWPQTAIT